MRKLCLRPALLVALASSGWAAAQPRVDPQAAAPADSEVEAPAQPLETAERQRKDLAVWYGHVESDNLERTAAGGPLRWNADPADVQRSVAQLVLTLVEFIRKLLERQAIRRMEEGTLTDEEVENVGRALMKLEETLRDIAARFRLSARGYHRVLRVARTIADLEGSEAVDRPHIAEAAGYRLAL